MGAVDFLFENVGSISAYIKVAAYVSPTTLPSGYADVLPLQNEAFANVTASPPSGALTGFSIVGPPFVLAPKGVLTRSYNLVAQRLGFFGSGIAATVTQQTAPYQTLKVSSTQVNITAVLRNPSDLRGAQIDISQVTRQGWGFDPAMDTATLSKKWGQVNATTGAINLSSPNYNEQLPLNQSGTGPAGTVGTPA